MTILKYILWAILATVAGIIAYVAIVFGGMKPLETGYVDKNLAAVKTKVVNFYVLRDDSAIICFDAGLDTAMANEGFALLKLDPALVTHVFLTHSDGDHTGGLLSFKNAGIYLPEQEKQMIDGTTKRYFFFRKKENALPVDKFSTISVNQTIMAGNVKIVAYAMPGHTPGSTVYLVNDSILITGDVANIDKKGQLEVPFRPLNNNHEQATASIDKLRKIKASIILTGHDGMIRPKHEHTPADGQ